MYACVLQVNAVHTNTRLAGLPNDYQPKKKCHLQKIQSKDPVENENGYHVSRPTPNPVMKHEMYSLDFTAV